MKLHPKFKSILLISLLFLGELMLSPSIALAKPEGPQYTRANRTPSRVILRHNPTTFDFHVPVPAAYRQRRPQTATIIIEYLPAGSEDVFGSPCYDWPTEAQAAFRFAANVWQTLVTSDVPIKIEACWTQFDEEGVLGYGGSMDYFTGPGNVIYPVSLANALAGRDLNDTDQFDSNYDGADADTEIFVAYSRAFNWYYGTDGNTPANKVDFASVVLHEICHGLGFSGRAGILSDGVTGYLGFFNYEGNFVAPGIYDTFVRNGQGRLLTSFANPSTQLGDELTGEDLFFDGPNAKAANGGTAPELFAPFFWMSGSSYSHLDESFNGTENALMTFALNDGESNHAPGPITMGLLKDIGWETTDTPTNTPPTLDGIPDQTLEANQTRDNAINLNDFAADAEDADTALSFSILNAQTIVDAGVSIDGSHYIDIAPASGYAGTVDVVVQVMDTGGLTDTDTFQLTVQPNTPPTLADIPDQKLPFNRVFNNVINLNGLATDAEDAITALNFSIRNAQAIPDTGVSIDIDNFVDIAPTTDYTGTVDVIVQVMDTGGLTDTSTFQLTITDQNFSPTLTIPDMSLGLNEDKTLDLWAYTTDLNDAQATLTYALIYEDKTTMSITDTARISGTHYLYIQPQDAETVRNLEVQVTDPHGATATSRFTVTFTSTSICYLPIITRQ